MGLDVFVQHPPFPARPGREEQPVCRLEPDGIYQHLAPFLPQSSSTGRRIQDVMSTGDVVFSGANLAQLRGCLERARAALDDRPSQWAVSFGLAYTRGEPAPRERYETVSRKGVRELIDRLLRSIDDAERGDGRLLFYGD